MSRENVEIIRTAWEAYGRGDLATAIESFAEDVVTVRDRSLPDFETYTGRDGVLQSLFEWAEGFDDFEQTPLDYADAGDAVLVRVRQEGTGSQSGARVALDVWMLFTFERDKIIRFEMFADEEQAREAAGLG